MCSQAQQLFLNFVPDLPEEKTMRYLSILIAVSLTMLFTSACQEESQPVAKEVPKVIQQQQKEAATAAATAEENTEKVMEQMKEEAHKSSEHAKAQAHKMMDASDEKMAEMHDGTFSAETLATGKMVYEKTCATCHATGLVGAPKIGDKEAWSAHIHHGVDHMVESAIKGKGAMPAKGGNASLSDDEVKAAVGYIVEQSR
jgi:cytochrome c5